MTASVRPRFLQDWRCEGVWEGVRCDRLLMAYDPTQTTLVDLKATAQIQCKRCKTLNGITARIPRAGDRTGGSW